MSLDRRELMRAGLFGGLGALVGGALGWRALRSEAAVAIRDRPLTFDVGRLGPGAVLVQRLVLPALRPRRLAIQTGFVPPEGPRLELHVVIDGERHGPLRAIPSPTPTSPAVFAWPGTREVSGPVELHVSGAHPHPSPPRFRAHGAIGPSHDWGQAALEGPELRRGIVSSQERLSGLLVPAHLPSASGPVRLDLFELATVLGDPFARQPLWPDGLEFPGDEPLRSVVLEQPPALLGGHLALRFEPIEDSYARSYAVRLRLPPGGLARGAPDGFGFVPVAGSYGPRPPFAGLFLDGRELVGCDLAVALFE